MITVTPIQDKAEQARLAALCGIPFLADAPAYAARGGDGQFAGMCQFSMDAAGGHLFHLATPTDGDPYDALFVMGRAALNFMDLCGAKFAFFEGDTAGREALLTRIGFTETNGRYVFSLEGFFTQPCKCGH